MSGRAETEGLQCVLNAVSQRNSSTIKADQIQCQVETLVVAKLQGNKVALNKQQRHHLTRHHPHHHCLIHPRCHRGQSSAPEVLDSPQFPALAWTFTKHCRYRMQWVISDNLATCSQVLTYHASSPRTVTLSWHDGYISKMTYKPAN